MDSDDAPLLQGILDHPDDRFGWLVLADWLEERGDRRAEFIRLRDQLLHDELRPREPKEARLRELAEQVEAPTTPTANTPVGGQLAFVPPGRFWMGSPVDEPERMTGEKRRLVQIASGFWLGVHTVTQAEFSQVIGRNPSHFSPDGDQRGDVREFDTSRFPVEGVSWYDAIDYCNRLSKLEGEPAFYSIELVMRQAGSIVEARVEARGGTGYRLPTEAEWEPCR